MTRSSREARIEREYFFLGLARTIGFARDRVETLTHRAGVELPGKYVQELAAHHRDLIRLRAMATHDPEYRAALVRVFE